MTQPQAEPRTIPADTSPPPSTPPSSTPQGVRAPSLGVRPTPSTETPESAPAGFPGGASGEHSGPADPFDTNTHFSNQPRDPGPDAEPLKLPKGTTQETARGLVLAAGVQAHRLFARYPEEQEGGLWLVRDEKQAAGIADPVVRMVQRRAGDTLVNPDANDALQVVIAAAGYLLGNLVPAVMIRWQYRRAQRVHGVPDEQEEQ